MPPKPKDESEMTTEEFLASLQEATKPKDKKTIREHTKETGGIRGYFSKRKKIMEELDK